MHAPGDQVMVKTGAFAGMRGRVLSAYEAKERGFPLREGDICVTFFIYDREVQAVLCDSQLEKASN
jgi:transcription antitermination factor NusG